MTPEAQKAKSVIENLWADDVGAFDVDVAKESLTRGTQGVHDFFRKLGQVSLPKMQRMSELVANAGARLVASPHYARNAASHFADVIIGPDPVSPVLRSKFDDEI